MVLSRSAMADLENMRMFIQCLIESTNVYWSGEYDVTFGQCPDKRWIGELSDILTNEKYLTISNVNSVVKYDSVDFGSYRICLPPPDGNDNAFLFMSMLWAPTDGSVNIWIDTIRKNNDRPGSIPHYWFTFRIERPSVSKLSNHDFYHSHLSFEKRVCFESGEGGCKKFLPKFPLIPIPAENIWESILMMVFSIYGQSIGKSVFKIMKEQTGLEMETLRKVKSYISLPI